MKSFLPVWIRIICIFLAIFIFLGSLTWLCIGIFTPALLSLSPNSYTLSLEDIKRMGEFSYPYFTLKLIAQMLLGSVILYSAIRGYVKLLTIMLTIYCIVSICDTVAAISQHNIGLAIFSGCFVALSGMMAYVLGKRK